MKFTTKTANVFGNLIQFKMPDIALKSLDALAKAVNDGKELEVQVAVKRKKRSLNANAALWALLGEMAGVLHTSKDELYLEMLDRYGVFTHVVVKPQAVDRVKQEWRTVRELGPVTINGTTGIQLQCYFGSHTYNTLEFSRLLDGVISEAKEIGIDFISQADRNLLLEEWGKQKEQEHES